MANFIEELINSDLRERRHTSIVTRFPPEPNGYLHIGHAKAICLNYGLAVKFRGICNLRFDDTNPIKEDEEYVDAIFEDMKWMGWRGNVYYASDYFEKMFECAVQLIKKGKAYVDNSTPEQIKQMRGDLTHPGTNSEARNRDIETNLKMFYDMRKGIYGDGMCVLRAKIDMASPNINMRDPVIYRVLKIKHHKAGDKWNIYPMYDFAHPLEDAIEGITHSCCSLEFEDHRPLYDWVLENCGDFKVIPHQYEFARLNIMGVPMSKRYLKKLVDDQVVDGWDDPRMPTLCGLRRRGYTATAIRDFCEKIGISKSNSIVDPALLESCIREELNLSATRVMAAVYPIQLIINNRPDNWIESLEFNTVIDGILKQNRKITISKNLYIDRADFSQNPPPKYKRLTVGNKVRLKSAYIITCTHFDIDNNGQIDTIYCDIIEGTKSGIDTTIKASGVIQWVDANNCVDISINQFNSLVDIEGKPNQRSLTTIPAKLEKYAHTQKGTFQFLRHGYYCFDIKNKKVNKNILNEIVGLKDGFKK